MTTSPPTTAYRAPTLDRDTLDYLASELERLETLHRSKVIDLARRILPHLTAEDIRNPHDFPELTDPDWHFEDGQLSSVQAILLLVRKLRRDQDPDDRTE